MATENLPRYRVLYELLRRRIEEEIYRKGDLLPSENELAALHNMTRPTVRKALELLLHEGFIQKHQGRGSIVQGKPVGIGILSFSGTTSVIGEERLQTRIIVKPEIRSWERALSFELGDIEKEIGCIYFERLRLVNDKAIFYDTTLIPNINLPRFTSRQFENKSLFDILRKNYNIQVTGGEQKIFATKADPVIQKYFGVPKNHPILKLDRKLQTNRPGFYFYSQVTCNTEETGLYGTF
ncbi:MAG: GntR family transcriptional regulator [Candidatus Heimdallarchaeota archaeon]|nr:GntR family transcriptional regulator [Candidatus Heimdallarchaeota archaeon]